MNAAAMDVPKRGLLIFFCALTNFSHLDPMQVGRDH